MSSCNLIEGANDKNSFCIVAVVGGVSGFGGVGGVGGGVFAFLLNKL